MAVELATAYVSLVPTMKGVQNQISSQLSSPAVASQLDKTGKSWGSRLMGGIATTAKVGAVAVGTVTTAMGALIAKGGIDRALNLEDARGRLIGLGHDTKTVEQIMDNAYNSTLGTAYRADEAAKVAASAVAAGIKPGKELESTLALMGDAAYIAGIGMDEMGAIFNKVAASDMIQGDVIAQLGDRGIPILQLLSDELGVTAAEVRKMASNGEIDFATFRSAMEAGMGGAAQEAGKTTRGAIANMMVGFSRIGQTVVEKLVPNFRTAFNEITVILYGLNDRLAPAMERFSEWFGPKMEGHLDGFGEKFLDTIDNISPKFLGFFDNAREAVNKFFADFRAPSKDGDSVGAVFSDITGSLKTLVPALADARAELPSLTDLLKLAAGVLGFFAENVDTVVKFMPLLLAGYAAWKVAMLANLVLGRQSAIATFAQIAATRQLAASNRALIASQAGATAAQAQHNTVQRAGILASIRQTAANVAHRVAMIATTVATKAWTVAQKALNLVLKANPIGLVITILGLLVGALVMAYQKSETFRKIVNTAWAGIKVAAEAAWKFLRDVVFEGIKKGLGAVGQFFKDRKRDIDITWAALKTLLKAGWDWIGDKVFDPMKRGVSAIGEAFGKAKDVVKKAWDKIKGFAAKPANFVIETVYMNGIRSVWNKIAGAIGLDNLKLPRVNSIRGYATGGYTGPGQKMEPAGVVHKGEFVFDQSTTRRFRPFFEALHKGKAQPPGYSGGGFVGGLWDKIKGTAGDLWSGAKDVVGAIGDFVTNPAAGIKRLISGPVETIMKNIGGGDWGQMLMEIPRKVISGLTDKVRDAFTAVVGGGSGATGGAQLRGARPYVAAAARMIANSVGGVNLMQAITRSNAGGHPKGLAVDFHDTITKLNRLAMFAAGNSGRFGIDYIAWQKRIFKPGRGWGPQNVGYGSDPWHRRHVHVEHRPRVFDDGGWLTPGYNVVDNRTGKMEKLANVTDKQVGEQRYIAEIHRHEGASAEDLAEDVLFAFRRLSRGSVYEREDRLVY